MPSAASTHEDKVARWIGAGKIGTEIGAFKSPVPGLQPAPYYVDCFPEFGREKVRADYYGEACNLPFRDNSLDYVVTSHVLEHVANPVAALAEWHRVLRPGGIIYLVVPDRRLTWDRPRPLTPVSHLLQDYERKVTACDPTHIDDFAFGVEDSFFGGTASLDGNGDRRKKLAHDLRAAVQQGQEINIHFHTFEPSNVLGLLAALKGGAHGPFSWDIVDQAERFPADNPIGFLAVVRVKKSASDRLAGWRNRHRSRKDPLYPLRPDARAFADLAATPAPPAPAAPATPAALDAPAEGSLVDPLCVRLTGWAWFGTADPAVVAIEAWAQDQLVGETSLLHARSDVSAALALPAGARPAFDFFAHDPAASFGGAWQLALRGRRADGTRTDPVLKRTFTAIGRDYRQADYGVLLDQATIAVHHRANIYTSGPSLSAPSGELAARLRQLLGPPPRRILDVGCGLGSYGRGLLADGYDWMGAEVKAADCVELTRLGLPHRQVDGKTLPFADASFDAAISIEVLEHIEDPLAFLAEVRRVAPRQLIISVPNCELLSYMSPRLAAPWHLLEGDHKNFFTRWSLASLLRQFYPQVEVGFHTVHPLPTVEGTPVYYHLLAVASSPA